MIQYRTRLSGHRRLGSRRPVNGSTSSVGINMSPSNCPLYSSALSLGPRLFNFLTEEILRLVSSGTKNSIKIFKKFSSSFNSFLKIQSMLITVFRRYLLFKVVIEERSIRRERTNCTNQCKHTQTSQIFSTHGSRAFNHRLSKQKLKSYQ